MMEIKPVKKKKLFKNIQIFMLKALLKESEDDGRSENEKLSKYIKKYSESFRDLWIDNEDD